MGDLVLASTSRYRRQLLERLGLPFRCEAPRLKEEHVQDKRWSPYQLAEARAVAKADSVAAQHREGFVIGSDQLVALDGQVFGKPYTHDVGKEQLTALSGKTHELITSLVVWHAGAPHKHTDVTRLTMWSLDEEQIERYLSADEPFDCCGSYKLEARGIALFRKIESEDFTAIEGLPLIALTGILRRLGFQIP